MLEGERILKSCVAACLVRGMPSWGGQLVLTDQRILFRPLDVSAAANILREGIDLLPDNLAVLGQLVGKALDYSTAYGDALSGAIETARITGVRRGRNASLTRPPTLVLSYEDGHELEVGLLASRSSLNLRPQNSVVRDEMMRAVEAQIAGP